MNDDNIKNRVKSPSLCKRVERILYDGTKGFIDDDCYAKASALTFYSLLSIVPIFAVLFGVAKGFGFEKALEWEMNERFAEQQELMQQLIQFAYSWLENVQGGVIAGIGTVALLWSVFGLLNNVETVLNSIWKTPIAKSYSRKISDYLATMLICPIFLVTSSSITVFLSTQITETAQYHPIIEVISPYLLMTLKIFPFFLSWILFTFIYLFMPNTKTYWRSGIIAGIAAGTTFQLWQWAYIKFQIYASGYGAIYGSFAAFPLFLIWLQISWIILLVGAEIAFEIENDFFIPYRKTESFSSKGAALLIIYRCVEAFELRRPPQTDRTLAQELGISLYHLHLLLDALQKEGLLSAVFYRDKTIGYQPARPSGSITFATVCEAIEKSHELRACVNDSVPLQKIQNYLQKTKTSITNSADNQPVYNP